MPLIHNFRLQATRQLLDSWGSDGLLITSATNRRWLSGFTGSAGALLITKETAIIATDSRYWEQAESQAKDFELFKDHRKAEDTKAFIKQAKAQKIVIEANDVSINRMMELEGLTGISWIPQVETVETLRQIKTTDEIEAIRLAAEITDFAMQQVPVLLRTGLTEKSLAWQLEKLMRENGADSLAFPAIVAFGANSARPHHEPGERDLRVNDIVLIDMGASCQGYKSDLTRTFLFAPKMDARFSQIFNLVNAAQSAAIKGTQPGSDSKHPALLAQMVVEDGGYGAFFGPGFGHSLGLDIHESPFLSTFRPPISLEPGMVLTYEPGIYLPGWGGIRIEDLTLLNQDGLKLLSSCEKVPLVAPK